MAAPNAKALSWLGRGIDRGLLPLVLLAASLALGLVLAAAELMGIDSLCPTRADAIVFAAATSVACACLALCYLFRARRALAYFLGASGISCLFIILYFPLTPISAMAFLCYAALPLSLYLPFPAGFAASAGALAVALAARFAVLPPESIGQRSASFRDVLAFVAAPLAASALVSALSAFRAEAARLAESLLRVARLNLSYQDYSASVEEKSALEERLRLTRDLHDVVGYALTNTIMTMRAAALMCAREPEKAPAFLDAAREDAERALSQVREMLGAMRGREIRIAAGPTAIARAVRAFKAATGVEIDLDFGNFDWAAFGAAEEGDEAALAASHFVQEGLLNAFSHGGASSIRVSFRASEGSLSVRVRDNGSGAASVQEGIGIAGMRERIERLGGELEYGSSPSGFDIEMRLPLEGGARRGGG